MNKIDRNIVSKPECLIQKAEEWTTNFIDKRKIKSEYWNWHKYHNETVNSILIKELEKTSKKHCSYCGIYPLEKNNIRPTIDHFKPKSKFPELAFEWTNLFMSCDSCQEIKKGMYPINPEPLKPDSCHYHFDYWFDIDFDTGDIISNIERTENERRIAIETIKWLGFNNENRPEARKKVFKNYKEDTDIWNYSYPFFLKYK